MKVTIEKLVYGGAGLARTNDGVVFVPRTAPGDVAEIEVRVRKKDYATARLKKLLIPSPDRQEPFCPNYSTAGCCHWQHLRYARQLAYKADIVRESLTRLAKIEFPEQIKIISGPDRAYRLRATFHVHNGTLGFVRENTNVIVPIRECAALVPELNAFIASANALKLDVTSIDVIASGTALGATFRCSGRPPSRDAVLEIPGLASLTFQTDTRRLHYERRAPYIEARGFKYGLNSDAFFQANRFLLDVFIDEVMSQAGPSPSYVLDLYSGSGFFSIPLATVSRQLIGVESNRVAVKQAKENAKLNDVWNAEFAVGNVDTTLAGANVHPELVVLNPPRTGAGPKVASQVAALKAVRIVYISCNPTTFARETVILVKAGYRLKRLTMIDQFPHTYHIELVGQFELQ